MIHQKGIELTTEERRRLAEQSMTQDRQIALLFRNRPARGLTFYDVVQATGFNQDSVKRSISNMAGSKRAPKKYRDKYGRYPLVKTDQKKLNPSTGVRVHVYRWNPRYGQLPDHHELLKMNSGKQMNFHQTEGS